jgi:hypothetical protein
MKTMITIAKEMSDIFEEVKKLRKQGKIKESEDKKIELSKINKEYLVYSNIFNLERGYL